MVERIILLKLNDGVSRDEVARLCHARFGALPELVTRSVGVPADAASEKSWDVSIVLRFPTLLALNTALKSAPFRDLFERELRDLCVVIKAWSFAALA